MSNTVSGSMKRRLEIAARAATPSGCLVNRKWCFALMQEPAMKWLVDRRYVTYIRRGEKKSKYTIALLTEDGKAWYDKSNNAGRTNSKSRSS